MAVLSAIMTTSRFYKYILPCFVLLLFGGFVYALVYVEVDFSVLVPGKYQRNRLKFVSRNISKHNNTFHLHGTTYRTVDGSQVAVNLSVIKLDLKTVRKFKEKFYKEKLKHSPLKEIKVNKTDCAALFEGNKEVQETTELLQKDYARSVISPEEYTQRTKNCDTFKVERGYVTKTFTTEEEDFPIAFSLLMFKDVEQVERLLRAIYRPQNYYCIHVDKKSTDDVREAMTSIAKCFNNVFLTARSVDVQWGQFSVLEPEIICLEQLWKYKKWKYFINLTGQEFPLKTNYQLVKILKAYNGSNDLEGTVKRANKNRWEAAGAPPHNITAVKGSVHIVVNRGFVDYVLHNQTAKDFLEWTKKVGVPDETFFTSLNHNPQLGIPGSYKGEPETDQVVKPFLARFKNWGTEPFQWPCAGQRVRLICIFGIGDLPLLKSRKELFANKFYWDYQPFALDCMEELHYNRTRDEFLGLSSFDNSYYKTLGFVKNKV